jgi:hypothetical protein
VEEFTGLMATVVLAVLGVTGSAFVEVIRAWRKRKDQPAASEITLEARLTDLGDLMRSSSLVLEEVQAEIQARIALAEKAKQDAEEAAQVAQLNEAQRIAMARLVRAEMAVEVAKGGKRSFWQGFAINLLFFIAGVGASVVTALVIEK